ncbi:FAD-dependent oxidoreductase [Myxococcota bacterium]|nr:FAD-dependent oxidoreductase [Myxococcota bacterium]
MSGTKASHCVAVIGGAVAGAEVAGTLAKLGTEVVVFEQNPRPYGKIEDGLPRWHVALREKEYKAIGALLGQEGVHYVPNTRIGDDLSFRELTDEWGFSGVVLACGAWRDRPLPVDGADAYVGRGLIYQNPFILWFNHFHEPNYSGEQYIAMDGAIVVGGGLASIDVAKALMLETTRAKLLERGIEVDSVELEVKGIPKILAAHDLVFEDLGLEGCTIYYRRREQDMPLVEIPDGATPEREAKVRNSREKLLTKATEKYRFKVEALCMPDDLLVEDDQLVGLRFRRTRAEDGKVIPTEETFERRGPYVISSIGSIPEPIEGIPMKGELFAFTDWDLGRLDDYPSVFSAGNVVTGKGNIVASRKHARGLGSTVAEAFLGISESGQGEESAALDAARAELAREAEKISNQITTQPPISPDALDELRERVRVRQREIDYPGDYATWIESVKPYA